MEKKEPLLVACCCCDSFGTLCRLFVGHWRSLTGGLIDGFQFENAELFSTPRPGVPHPLTARGDPTRVKNASSWEGDRCWSS